MAELTVNISFNKNEGLVMSPSNLIDLYLSGIPLCYPNGGKITEYTIKQKIQSAQKEIENLLSIKINRQLWEERKDFVAEEVKRWGYIKSTFLISEPEKLSGFINNVQQVKYPKNWLSIKSGSDKSQARNMFLVPNTGGQGAQMDMGGYEWSGVTPHMGWFGSDFIPNYWKMEYWTGWCPKDVPADLIEAIGKYASIQILAITGDLIYGAGIGNQSVSLDGISQQYSTTKGGGKGAFAGRVGQYADELFGAGGQIERLKGEYLGINFRVM